MTDRDTRREQIARIIAANVGFDSLVDGAAAYAIADAAASAVLAAGLVVPSGPRTYDELSNLLPEAAIEVVGDREELVIYTGWSLAVDGETLEEMHDDGENRVRMPRLRLQPDEPGDVV